MKKLWIGVLGVILMLGMLGSTPANATSITKVAAADTTLTVVFGAPAEFDPVPAAKAEVTRSAVAVVKTDPGDPQPGGNNNPAAVPEPSTLILLGLGMLALLGLKRQKKN